MSDCAPLFRLSAFHFALFLLPLYMILEFLFLLSKKCNLKKDLFFFLNKIFNIILFLCYLKQIEKV